MSSIESHESKKLINNNIDNLDIKSDLLIKQMQENFIISNKDALRDKIHEIHNFLRNNGAGYGMNALKVFNILYGLKKIEESNLFDKLKLKPECRFSYLLKLAEEYKSEELAEAIYKHVLDSLYENKLNELLFYEIPRNIKSTAFTYLVKEINKISQIENKCNVLLSGKIYEYFIGRDRSAISELGAYFTDRHIVDFIYKKLKLEINNNNTIKTMIDMFGGSGGFTTGYIDYLNKKYPNKINWDTELHKIYHHDANIDVIKSAGLEFFCMTGVIPDLKNNLYCKNSFKDEFNNNKYDYVITNPPYGGDKIKTSDTKIKLTKIKNYIKEELKTLEDKNKIKYRKNQLKDIENIEKQEKKDNDKNKVCLDTSSNRINKLAHQNDIPGNDKESISLMLMMDLLKENGTCVGVLKEGIFFNRIYTKLRKYLIENFNVREVISIPSDQFENTTVKTSIIIFDNTENKTKEIKFYDLVVEKYEEDKFEEINNIIMLSESKGDIKNVSDKIVNIVSIDKIIKNKIYSLNAKDYEKITIKCGEDYKLVKLGDICEYLPKSKRNASFGESEGKYNFYVSSDNIKKCNEVDYNEECIIIGTGGNSCIHYVNDKFSCSADTLLIKSEHLNNKLLYFIMLTIWNDFINCMSGSVIKHMTKDIFNNYSIPIPKSDDRIKYWTNRISKPYDEINNKKQKIIELEEKIKNKIKDIEENDEYKLDDICEIKFGTRITKKDNEIGDIPVYGGGKITFYTNKHNRNENTLVISRFGISKKCVRLIPYKFFLNDSGLSIHCKDDKLTNYINHYLLIDSVQNTIYTSCTTGSIQRNINMDLLNNFQIKIPKDKKILSNLDKLFEELDELQKDITKAEKKYNKYIQELKEEAIIDDEPVSENSDNDSNNNSDNKQTKESDSEKSNKELKSEEDTNEKPIKKSKKSKKTKEVLNDEDD